MTLIDMYTYFEDKGDMLDKEIDRQFGQREDVRFLTSFPGIGTATAAQICSMIVNIDRFETADKMRSYFGMAPKVKDSGESVKHGHITRRGDPMMRKVLGRVVSQMMIRALDDSIACYRESHRGAMRPGMLIVACMNKLLDIIFAVLKYGTPYVHR